MASTRELLLQLLLVSLSSASYYFGGTVTYSYKGRNPDGTFRVDLHNRAAFDGCQSSLDWSCYTGNCGYNTTSQKGVLDRSNNAPQHNKQWCETETVSTRNIPSDNPFQMNAAGCCWTPTRNSVTALRLMTYVDLGTRSDTGKPNQSPDIAILPLLRVPQNCPRTYKLMSFDPDGDKVRCRYGNIIGTECSSCNQPSGFHLDQGSCTLHYRDSNADPRVYGFELVVEDFPQGHVSLTYTDGSRSSRDPLTVRRKRQVTVGIKTQSTATKTTVGIKTQPTTTKTTVGTKTQPTTTKTTVGTKTQPTTTKTTVGIKTQSTATKTTVGIKTQPTTTKTTVGTKTQPTTTKTTVGTKTPPTTTKTTVGTKTQPTTTKTTVGTKTQPTTTKTTVGTKTQPTTTKTTVGTKTPPTTTKTTVGTKTPPTTTKTTVGTKTQPTTTKTTVRTTTSTQTTMEPLTTAPSTTELPTTTAPITTNPWWWWWYSTTTTEPPTTSTPTTMEPPTTTAPTTTEPPTTTAPITTNLWWWWWYSTTTSEPPTTSTLTTMEPPTTTAASSTPYTTEIHITTAPTAPITTNLWWWWWYSTTATEPPATSTPSTTELPTTTEPPSTTAATTTTTPTTTAAPNTPIPWYTTTTQALTTTTLPYSSITTDLRANTPPLSKLPLQFSLLVDPPAPSCQEGLYLPKFVHPTPENGAHIQVEVNKEVEIRVKAQATYATIHDIIISGPLNIRKLRITHDEFVIRWTPTADDLGDHYPICFAVESVTGSAETTVQTTQYSNNLTTPPSRAGIYQSEMRCVLVDIGTTQVVANVICSQSTMTVEVEKSSFSGLNEDHLRLSDPTNTACSLQTHSNSTHIIAVIPLNACGTQIEEDDDNLIFKNEITTVDNTEDLITRENLLEVHFYCQYPKRVNMTLGYTKHRKSVTVREKGFGMFTYRFEFFPDNQFQTMIDPSSYPVEFDVGSRIYMQIDATSSANNTELFVESCSAAPHDNPNYQPTYSIIENGCKVDSTVEIYSSNHKRQFQISMEAFKFTGLHEQMFISCSVLMCEAGDPNTRCSQGCINSTSPGGQHHNHRKREAATQSLRHLVSQGPLRLKRSAESTGSPVISLDLNLVFIAGCLLAAVGMICALAMYKAKMSRVKYQPLPAFEN